MSFNDLKNLFLLLSIYIKDIVFGDYIVTSIDSTRKTIILHGRKIVYDEGVFTISRSRKMLFTKQQKNISGIRVANIPDNITLYRGKLIEVLNSSIINIENTGEELCAEEFFRILESYIELVQNDLIAIYRARRRFSR